MTTVQTKTRLILGLCACVCMFLLSVVTIAAEQDYDVVLETSIRGSAEQPKMIFILPWRSDVKRALPEKKQIPGHFDHLTIPVSKVDVEHNFDVSKRLGLPGR